MSKNYLSIKLGALVLLLALSYACNNNPGSASGSPGTKKDSVKTAGKKITPAWNDSLAGDKAGILGIYEVPEMLSLCRLDSAPMKEVSSKMVRDFSLLEKDLRETGVEIDGSQGIIYYNNSPENFKFECFLLIKSIPLKKNKTFAGSGAGVGKDAGV